ncbi:MAG TPA: HAMP domain-containing sensor histidine kinase [Gemmatimonadaceae bacterium]|nr:HAMP domain-containing sensor histidine kinase [Gemmatimonadaceae bacterium]
MKRIGFRGRLFLILLSFALVPTLVLTFAWAATTWLALPLGVGAWDSTAESGAKVIEIARAQRLSRSDATAVTEHEQALKIGVMRSKQATFTFRRLALAGALASLIAFVVLLVVSSRVAGHLSRSLSRPLQELVGWTERIAQGEPLPDDPPKRGAPEFATLRDRMRDMAAGLERGRRAALEAERLSALRETARQVAHELKNPLTPIRFAVDRLRRQAPAELQETIEVLSVESARLEELARSFAQFGRLPEGPRAPVDLGELARYTARSSVPSNLPVAINVGTDVPLIDGHHEALARALSNVMLNAVEACRDGGSIAVDVSRVAKNGSSAVQLSVRDTGCGIPPDRMARIWEPYVTYKSGGTGLGLAIARQTVLAHEGDVSAESEPGRGTTIRFTFPLTHADPVTGGQR